MKDLISKQTRDTFAMAIQYLHALETWSLLMRMREAGISPLISPHDQNDSVEQYYRAITWTSRESVLKIIPVFEETYRRLLKLPAETRDAIKPHLDSFLENNGFAVRNGRIVRR